VDPLTLSLKISSGIGCAGEIKITQAPEYEKWAIDILVKFRDNEKLQLLTAQRQSGGVCNLLLSGGSQLTVDIPGTISDDNPLFDEFDRGSSRSLLIGR
jgi:hypothetical protein